MPKTTTRPGPGIGRGFGTDADEVPTKATKPQQANPDLGEHTLVMELNRQWQKLFGTNHG